MNNKQLLTYYSNMKKTLELILKNNDILNNLNNKVFLNAILDYLSSFNALEKTINPDDKKAFLFLDKINEFSKTTNTLSDIKIDFSTDSQLKDIDKYLRNAIKNTINIDLDNLMISSGDNVEKTTQATQKPKQVINDMSQYDYKLSKSVDQVIAQKALARIKEDELKGTHYFYDSKPKQIPIIKLAISVILLVALIAYFAIIIIDFVNIILSGSSFTVNLFFSLLLPIILICLGINFFTKQLKRKKSDNERYNFSFFFYIVLILLGIFFLFESLLKRDVFSGMSGYLWLASEDPTSLEINNYKNFLANNNLLDDNRKITVENLLKRAEELYARFDFNSLYKSKYSMYVIGSSLLIILSIPTSIGYIYRPKRNHELQQKILNQYIEEAKKQFEEETKKQFGK